MRLSRPARAVASTGILNILKFFALYAGCTVLELAFQNQAFTTEMPAETRNFMMTTLKFAPGPTIAFVLQAMLCLLILSAITEGLRRAFRVRSLWVALYVISVSVIFNLSQIPQVFAAKISFTVVQAAQMALFPVLLSLPVAGLWLSLRKARRERIGAVAGLAVLLALGLLNYRSPHFLDHADHNAVRNLPNDSILVLSLDSLRPDWVAEYIVANPNSEFARFAKRSVQFENIVTTTAKTHSSLTTFLTGERPEEHGMRDNLFPGFLDTDALYANKGLVPALRERGYQTKMLIDETKFAPFQEGQAFDEVAAPPYGYVNLLATEVFSSTLYWSYFSNFIGDAIIPIAKQNFAFAHGYKPKNFLSNIYRYMATGSSHPIFMFAHTCSLHYPATSRTPYLERYQTDPHALVTRYPNFFKFGKFSEDPSLKEYRNLARGKLDLVMDEVVEPFLRELRESGALDRVHVLLMSDHGETFWKPGLRYSRLQLPYHGQPAILDEDSHRMFALLSSPRLEPERIDQIQGIADLTAAIKHLLSAQPGRHKLSSVLDNSPMRYSESGVLGYGIFNSTLSLSNRVQIDGFSLTKDGGMTIKPEETTGIVLQKTRTVVLKDEHWSFFPTNYGYETVVCKLPICWTPTNEDRGRAGMIVEFLNAQSAIDQKNGIALRFENSFSSAGDIRVVVPPNVKLQPETEWFFGVNEINQRGRIDIAYDLWMHGLIRQDSRDAIRYRAFQSLLEICAIGNMPVMCQSFRAWLSQPDLGVPQLKRWAAMDDEWSEFLRGHWFLKPFRSIFKLKAIRKSLANDEFAQALATAEKTGRSTELREFVEVHRDLREMDETFFRRFWSATQKRVPTTSGDQAEEIRDIHKKFEIELNLGFYEVDTNWLSFLLRYEKFEGSNLYRKIAENYLQNGRTPYLATVATVVPSLLQIRSGECYRTKILPQLLDGFAHAPNSNESWQQRFYHEARKLETVCQK